MKLSELNPHPQNPRKASEKKLTMLEKSLQEFGDLGSIVYNLKTGRIVSGHQRIKVLPEHTEIEMLDSSNGYFELNGDRFYVRFVNWEEDKEKAAMLRSNNSAGEWSFPDLSDTLSDLSNTIQDWEITGFEESEVEKILAPIDAPKEKKLKECPKCHHKF